MAFNSDEMQQKSTDDGDHWHGDHTDTTDVTWNTETNAPIQKLVHLARQHMWCMHVILSFAIFASKFRTLGATTYAHAYLLSGLSRRNHAVARQVAVLYAEPSQRHAPPCHGSPIAGFPRNKRRQCFAKCSHITSVHHVIIQWWNCCDARERDRYASINFGFKPT